MGYTGSVNSHMASICPNSWTSKLIFCFVVKPARRRFHRLPSRGSFVLKKTRPWILGTCFVDFLDFWKWKRRGRWFGEIWTKFQPVTFDMDPFGDKKVPRTRTQNTSTTLLLHPGGGAPACSPHKMKSSCMEGGEGGEDPTQDVLHESIKKRPLTGPGLSYFKLH